MNTPCAPFRLAPDRRGQLAMVSALLAFQAQGVRSARNVSFAEGRLSDAATPSAPRLVIASGMAAPARQR